MLLLASLGIFLVVVGFWGGSPGGPKDHHAVPRPFTFGDSWFWLSLFRVFCSTAGLLILLKATRTEKNKKASAVAATGMGMMLLGAMSLGVNNRFFSYITDTNVLQESVFFPLGVLAFLGGLILLLSLLFLKFLKLLIRIWRSRPQ